MRYLFIHTILAFFFLRMTLFTIFVTCSVIYFHNSLWHCSMTNLPQVMIWFSYSQHCVWQLIIYIGFLDTDSKRYGMWTVWLWWKWAHWDEFERTFAVEIEGPIDSRGVSFGKHRGDCWSIRQSGELEERLRVWWDMFSHQ